MFFESRIHKLVTIETAMQAASGIKNSTFNRYDAITYFDKGIQVIIVDDAHTDDTYFGEVAVLVKREDGFLYQVESITAAWIDTPEALAGYFTQAIESPCNMGKRELQINTPNPTATAWFTCGCCGSGFRGNIQHQLKFDQDSGYGYCPSCEKRFHS